MSNRIKVLFLSPEVTPFAKSGGLADVAGSLPLSLKRLKVDVRIAMPFYRAVMEENFKKKVLIKDLVVPLGAEKLNTNIFETLLEDIPVYLIERDDMYDRPYLYGNKRGDFYDNIERFCFFCHSSLRLSEDLDFTPDIIHCNDWQTGIVPALLKGPYSTSRALFNSSSLFTIHNMGYQGIFPREKLPVTGLPETGFFHPEGLEYWGKISLLKAGIVYSDAITTVSPTYAMEIQTPAYGMGMEGILRERSRSLYGILNGVDYNKWDPSRDNHLAFCYSKKSISGKTLCKEALIKEMGLDPSINNLPLLGLVSRLDSQKGLDILVKTLDNILNLDVGMVILGSGDKGIQDAFRKAAEQHKGRMAIYIGFNEPLAHRIMAGIDLILIPSRYEPCGLTQMYALRYGTIPLVRATGGLNDTIEPFDEKTSKGNGFKFVPYDTKALLEQLELAIRIFRDKMVWKRLMANGMSMDFSWDNSAKAYVDLYRSIMKKDRNRFS
jgi:starch synthase